MNCVNKVARSPLILISCRKPGVSFMEMKTTNNHDNITRGNNCAYQRIYDYVHPLSISTKTWLYMLYFIVSPNFSIFLARRSKLRIVANRGEMYISTVEYCEHHILSNSTSWWLVVWFAVACYLYARGVIENRTLFCQQNVVIFSPRLFDSYGVDYWKVKEANGILISE